MKKLNKKGFTIVELVIVIAVIAILSAVLIPTFSSIIKKANKSNADQAAKNASTVFLSEQDNGQLPDGTWFAYIDGTTCYKYQVVAGEFKEVKGDEYDDLVIDGNDKVYGKKALEGADEAAKAAALKTALNAPTADLVGTDITLSVTNYTVLEDLAGKVFVIVPVA